MVQLVLLAVELPQIIINMEIVGFVFPAQVLLLVV